MSDARNKNAIRTKNGGRTITVGDVEIDVISSYSPAWVKEYTESFISYTGEEIKKLKSTRFRLTFSTYGIQPAELSALCTELKKEQTMLVCDEFTGYVRCDSISPELRNANFYGDFFGGSITLVAVAAEIPADGL